MTNMPIALFQSCIITLFSMLHVSSALGDNFYLSDQPFVELTICLQTPALSAATLPFSASESFSWGFNLQNIRRGENCHHGTGRRVLISTGLWYLRISSREGTHVLNMDLQTPGMESQKPCVF